MWPKLEIQMKCECLKAHLLLGIGELMHRIYLPGKLHFMITPMTSYQM